MKRFLACVLCLLMLIPSAGAAAQDSMEHRVAALADDVLAYCLQEAQAPTVQSWIDGALAEQAGVGAEWFVITLSQRGEYDFSAYAAGLREYLAQTAVPSASSRQKYALALIAAGAEDPWIAATAADSIGQQGVMSWIYGLQLLNRGVASPAYTADSAAQSLLALQLPDGGWAVSGQNGDPDVTAMAVQALAPLCIRDAQVAQAVDRAVALLSARQREDGGYASYGVPNPESAAQVLMALSALGIDGLQDERFIRGGCTLLDGMTAYQLPDGSFSHTQGGASSRMATVQVLQALTAWQNLKGVAPAGATEPNSSAWGWQPIAAAVIGGAALLICAVLLVKRSSWKNLAAVIVLAGALVAVVFSLDVQSADDYYSGQAVRKDNPTGTVTMSIICDLAAGKPGTEHLPADGVLLPETAFAISGGDTVYTILTEAARAHGLRLDVSGGEDMAYVRGINSLYEFALGDLSGWLYRVNGESPSVGCGQYRLEDGDVIQWRYSLEMGRDLE